MHLACDCCCDLLRKARSPRVEGQDDRPVERHWWRLLMQAYWCCFQEEAPAAQVMYSTNFLLSCGVRTASVRSIKLRTWDSWIANMQPLISLQRWKETEHENVHQQKRISAQELAYWFMFLGSSRANVVTFYQIKPLNFGLKRFWHAASWYHKWHTPDQRDFDCNELALQMPYTSEAYTEVETGSHASVVTCPLLHDVCDVPRPLVGKSIWGLVCWCK